MRSIESVEQREGDQLVLVSSPIATVPEHRLLKFATFMGVQPRRIVLAKEADFIRQAVETVRSKSCLAISLENLAAIRSKSSDPGELCRFLENRCSVLFVFGCAGARGHDETLAWLTAGEVCRTMAPVPASGRETTFQVSLHSRPLTRQLAGLDFAGRTVSPQRTFDIDSSASNVDPIMLADGQPMFLRTRKAPYDLFLLTGSDLPDIDEPVSGHEALETRYHHIIPFLVFLRYCFGETCWHASRSTARFIIDDPLLAKKYGFLDYGSLIRSMRDRQYGTSIAFIPWNYRRTSERFAGSLLDSEERLSLCIHGCDHTNKEFEGDAELLNHKARLALNRMERHRQRIGLPCESVMVFPQGRFSTSAIQALRDNNYLAAVNSTCFPGNARRDALKMTDLLTPAVTAFYGFPIFHRRYPRRLIDCGFDMFLGKPVLLVEHHECFRNGFEKIEEFVKALNAMEPELSWPTLSSQLTTSCLMRRQSTASYRVQFFTRRFQIRNPTSEERHFVLEKVEPDPSIIQSVDVDGSAGSFCATGDRIQLDIEIGAGQTKEIEVWDRVLPLVPALRERTAYSFGVVLRRTLSEFRDNTLARCPTLLRGAQRVVNGLKVAGS